MKLKSLVQFMSEKHLRLLKIFIVVLGIFVFVAIMSKIGYYIYCHTVAICHVRPPVSTEMMAKMTAEQYEFAVRDMNEGRYESAKQRLEFVVLHDPQYLDATEKLLEVEKILDATSTP